MYPSRMDDRGRVKLPVALKEYLEKFEDKRLFVTSLDRRIAQVYPIVLWKQTKKFLENFSEDPEVAENLAFNAADLGSKRRWIRRPACCSARSCAESLGWKISPSTCTFSVDILKF